MFWHWRSYRVKGALCSFWQDILIGREIPSLFSQTTNFLALNRVFWGAYFIFIPFVNSMKKKAFFLFVVVVLPHHHIKIWIFWTWIPLQNYIMPLYLCIYLFLIRTLRSLWDFKNNFRREKVHSLPMQFVVTNIRKCKRVMFLRIQEQMNCKDLKFLQVLTILWWCMIFCSDFTKFKKKKHYL